MQNVVLSLIRPGMRAPAVPPCHLCPAQCSVRSTKQTNISIISFLLLSPLTRPDGGVGGYIYSVVPLAGDNS